MERRQDKLQVSIPVILWFKTFMLLNGIYNMGIKDMLSQVGFDINKPSKLYFKGSILRYEYEGEEIGLLFEHCKLRNTGKSALMVVVEKEYVEGEYRGTEECIKYLFLSNLKTNKTTLIKDAAETNKLIYFKKNGNAIIFEDSYNGEDVACFCFQDCVFSGLTVDKPYLIKIIITNNEGYSYLIRFHFRKYGYNNFYDINGRNCLSLQEYLAGSTMPVSMEELCAKICEFYGINLEDFSGEYELFASIFRDEDKREMVANYWEKNGEVEIFENEEKTQYKREGKKLTLIPSKSS